jgi:hypothetical protein
MEGNEMAREIPTLAQRRARLKKTFYFLLAEIALVVIVLGVANLYAGFLLHRELAFIRQNGQPLTSIEALPPPIPQSQNAAPLYQRAAAVVQFNSSDDCKNLNARRMMDILRKNVQTINLIRQATDKSQCRFTLIRDENDILSTSPKETKLRDLARLLGIQARSEAQAGNQKAALQDVRRQFIMARHVANEPLMLCGFLAREMEVIANNTLAKVLLRSSLTSSEAHAFEASLSQINWIPYLHQILLTERVLDMEETQSFRDRSGTNGVWLNPVFKMDEMYSLRLWKEIIKDEENAPTPLPPDYGREIDERAKKMPFYAFTASTVTTLYSRVRREYDYSETQRREREIALALTIYHSQYHQYPITLEPAEKLWKSTFPLDIYSKKPFHYKSDGKTFLLYSVGPNGKDDGGIWKYNFKTGTTKDDLAWKN